MQPIFQLRRTDRRCNIDSLNKHSLIRAFFMTGAVIDRVGGKFMRRNKRDCYSGFRVQFPEKPVSQPLQDTRGHINISSGECQRTSE